MTPTELAELQSSAAEIIATIAREATDEILGGIAEVAALLGQAGNVGIPVSIRPEDAQMCCLAFTVFLAEVERERRRLPAEGRR